MRGQSRFARLRRLREGACPIHGIGMGQIGLAGLEEFEDLDPQEGEFVAQCPRRDCTVTGQTHEPFGAITLVAEWRHLTEQITRARGIGSRRGGGSPEQAMTAGAVAPSHASGRGDRKTR